jgi:hypothetical protein
VVLAVAPLVAGGCAGTTQADNPAEFRQVAAHSGFGVAFAPEEESQPDIVTGAVWSGDGVRSEFVFSFGPGPDKLPDGLHGSHGTTWFNRGDRLEYWIQGLPSGLTKAATGRYIETILNLQEIACRVVADRPCFA